MKCPFCLTQIAESNQGKIICSNCHAKFEIDDRAECVFVDTESLRVPVNGFICRSCGLVQGGREGLVLFLWCGFRIDHAIDSTIFLNFNMTDLYLS